MVNFIVNLIRFECVTQETQFLRVCEGFSRGFPGRRGPTLNITCLYNPMDRVRFKLNRQGQRRRLGKLQHFLSTSWTVPDHVFFLLSRLHLVFTMVASTESSDTEPKSTPILTFHLLLSPRSVFHFQVCVYACLWVWVWLLGAYECGYLQETASAPLDLELQVTDMGPRNPAQTLQKNGKCL